MFLKQKVNHSRFQFIHKTPTNSKERKERGFQRDPVQVHRQQGFLRLQPDESAPALRRLLAR